MATALAVCGAPAVPASYVGLSGAHNLRKLSDASASARSVCTRSGRRCFRIRAFFDVQNDPIVKEVLKEPVAFLGGVFAGLLRLDLNEDPLREWVAKTAEAAGVKIGEEEVESASSEDAPSEIEIE
ncbi:hypothetical protein R1flu_019891 [Riccia fluitans]|uniref:Uncharacterized protein n=1 Tax=Riccia fluitans TaxID=41844 RepID=A0ABD1ZJX6_9MARC